MWRYLYALSLNSTWKYLYALGLSSGHSVLLLLLLVSVFFSVMAGFLVIHYATRKTRRD